MEINYYQPIDETMQPSIEIEIEETGSCDIIIDFEYDADIICEVLNKDYIGFAQLPEKVVRENEELEEELNQIDNLIASINPNFTPKKTEDPYYLPKIEKARFLIDSIDIELYKSLVDYVLLVDKTDSKNITTLQRLSVFNWVNKEAKNILSFKSSLKTCCEFNYDPFIYDEITGKLKNQYSTEDKYSSCLEYIQNHKLEIYFEYRYVFDNFEDFFKYVLCKAIQNNQAIKTCKNCGKYFYPSKRSDAIYCDSLSPQDSTKTCKVFGAAITRSEKEKQDEATKLYRQIYMSKQMLVKRNPDISAYKKDFENYKSQSVQWKDDIKAGLKSEAEFIEWLKIIKDKKV